METKLTIVTAAWNVIRSGNESAFVRCLKSVQRLPFPHEHIIIDGGSDDGTVALIERISPEGKIVSEKDEGIYDALNKGLSMASGDYFYVMGADDFIECPDALEAALLKARAGDLDMVISPVFSDTVDGRVLWPENPKKLRRILFRMCYSHQGLLMKTAVARKFGGFDLKYRIVADCKLAMKAMLGNASVAVSWRAYANFGQQGASSNSLLRKSEMIRLWGELFNLDPYAAELLENVGIMPLAKICKLLLSKSCTVRRAAFFMLKRRLMR